MSLFFSPFLDNNKKSLYLVLLNAKIQKKNNILSAEFQLHQSLFQLVLYNLELIPSTFHGSEGTPPWQSSWAEYLSELPDKETVQKIRKEIHIQIK